MARHTFEEIKVTGWKRARCGGCDTVFRRQRTFRMTVSPFNRGPDGVARTRDEIAKLVLAERNAWLVAPEMCVACAGGDRG